MKKSLLLLSVFALSLLLCGCNKSTDNESENICSEEECNVDLNVEANENTLVEEEDIEIPVAEPLEGDDMITISEGDLDSESIPESNTFEAPIE